MTLTANGTTTLKTFPGREYAFAFSGSFGGGSLAINYIINGVPAAFSGSPLTAPGEFREIAPSGTIQLVLTGATTPTLQVAIALAAGASGLLGIVDESGNFVVNGIALLRKTQEEWDAVIPQIPALDELIVSPTGALLKGDGVLPGRELPLLTSVTNPFTTIRAGDTAEVRAAENWKVFGFIEIEDGAFIEIEDGGTVQFLTA
jgi:hypothetical protein